MSAALRRIAAWSLGALCMATTVVMSADLEIVHDGQPCATIYTAAKPNDKVKLAATELQTYLQKISGAKLDILTEADNPHGTLILVGPSSRASQAAHDMGASIPAGLTPGRRDEGFVVVCGDSLWPLVLAGNDAGPYHGTEYAVYEFLNRLGVRWFMPGDYGEVVPKLATITVPAMRVIEKPSFIMRNWWVHALPPYDEQESRWKLRNKMNPEPMFAVPGDSSVRNVLPPADRVKAEPDLFALNQDGTRNPYHPNLTNPKTIEYAANVIKKYLRQHPDANSYGFAPDDGLPRDYSPETLKLNQGFTDLLGRPGVPAEMSTTEEWIGFVNKVAQEVHRDFPGIYIATNGYANRNLPPQGVKLDDHLVIMFAAIWSCTLHAYDDPHCWQKVRQAEILRRWCELCPNVWVYNYNYQMLVSSLAAIPETRKIRRELPLMKKWGVIGFNDEARNQWMENGIQSRYLRAKLEWNADADAEAILRDYFSRWYGPAVEPMRAFYEALEDAIEKTPMHGHEDRVLPPVYTPELMRALKGHIARAEGLATAEPARTHVAADRLILDHLEGYVAMSAADAAGNWAEAARQCGLMMDARRKLHAISPFYVWFDETRYHSGIWYWGVLDRQKYYISLADMTSGKTGDLVATLPAIARLSTDPHDDGLYQEWYGKGARNAAWRSMDATTPFYTQGFEDAEGHPYVGNLWYRFGVNVPASARGRKVLLYVPAIETEAWCWVNGQYVGYRPYLEAYTRPNQMEVDVTSALKPGADNIIVLRVNTGLSVAQSSGGLVSRAFLYSPKEAPK
jgi:hypothetical protein